MQPNEIVSLFGTIKSIAEQTGMGPLTDQALAILTIGSLLDERLSNIGQELEETRIRQ